MKKYLLFILFILFFVALKAQILVTASQINDINTAHSAAEGDIYKDTENNVFYIGISSGNLKILGDVTKVNASLTGNGSVESPLGIAPQGAAIGQVLSWNGTAWIPANTALTADGSETKINNGTNTSVSGAGTIASPYLINVADATTGVKGVIQLAGDLRGTAALPVIAPNAVISAKILNGTILNEDIADNTIATGKILDGTILTQDIANSQITYAKIQNVTAQRILGNPTASAAAPSEISLGTGLIFTGTVLNATNNGTVTSVTGTLPITVTNTTTTPLIAITRNNIVTGASVVGATNPLVLDAGATGAVVGGANATLTVNNTAPLWNANQLRGKPISTTVPTVIGQILRWDGTYWAPYTIPVTNKKMVLSAEYPGAIITSGSGSNHQGTLIGGNEGPTNQYYMNYYQWTSTSSSTTQSYQVYVRITLPNDFTSWQTSGAVVVNYSTTHNNRATINFAINDLSNNVISTLTSPSNTSWQTFSINAATLSTWATAGQTVIFIFTLNASYSNTVKLGDITLNYQ